MSQLSILPKIVMTGGGANTLLARILQTSLGRTVEVLDSKISASRILKYLDGSTEIEDCGNLEVLDFDESVRSSLLSKESIHAQFYQEIQNAKEAIENVA